MEIPIANEQNRNINDRVIDNTEPLQNEKIPTYKSRWMKYGAAVIASAAVMLKFAVPALIAAGAGSSGANELNCIQAYGVDGSPNPIPAWKIAVEPNLYFDPDTNWWVTDSQGTTTFAIDGLGKNFQIDTRSTRPTSCKGLIDGVQEGGAMPVKIPQELRISGGDIQKYLANTLNCPEGQQPRVIGASVRDKEILNTQCSTEGPLK